MNDNPQLNILNDEAPRPGITRSGIPMLRRFGVATLQMFVLWLIAILVSVAYGFELYKTFQTPEAFLAEVFSGEPPPPQVLNIDASQQTRIAAVFGRAFPQSRLRYWRLGESTVWIFDDIGKEGYVPTTCGFVIRGGLVERLRVLIYRESRGEQVGELSFLQKIEGAGAAGNKLDRSIDSISGATLSVQMMERMARTAIELDAMTVRGDAP